MFIISDRRDDAPEPQPPNAARMYAYYLSDDCKEAMGPDRRAAEQVLKAAPEARPSALANRAWVHRAVRFLAGEAGIRHFLDIGSGIPISPNLHEAVQDVAPRSRVVYVDNDPVVLAHFRALTTSAPEGKVDYLRADMRHPESILDGPEVRQILNQSCPVALILAAVLHFVPDPKAAAGIVATLRDAMPPGSYLVLSHATGDFKQAQAQAAAQVYETSHATATVALRTRAEVESLFDGCELLEPGVVQAPLWRPDGPVDVDAARQAWVYGGVGRIGSPGSTRRVA